MQDENNKSENKNMYLIRDIRDKELKKLDWYAIRAASGGEAIPDNVKTLMQEWRDITDNCNPEADSAGNLILSSVNFPKLKVSGLRLNLI